jgi:MtN3 and saliva related transmembrane protein
MINSNIVGFIGCALIVISSVPQLAKIIYNKSSENVSIVTYMILLSAQCIWSSYGILNNDLPIIVTNIASGAITITIIIMHIYYRKK